MSKSVKMYLRRDLSCLTITLLLLLPSLQAYAIRTDQKQPSAHLKTVEHVVEVRGSSDQESVRHKSRAIRGTNSECSQERLDSILRSCEMAASTTVPSPTPVAGTEDTLIDRTVDAPLYFCGANCSHLALIYAAECSMQEFLVNVTGACKLMGLNLTLECIYAVVTVKQGITACTRIILDVESSHDEDMPSSLFDPSKEYMGEQCCSLQTSYSHEVMHEVYVDRMGNAITEPPLIPPWLMTNSSEYQPLVDITNSDLCVVSPTTGTTESLPTALNLTDSDKTITTSSAHTISLHSLCRLLHVCMFCLCISWISL